MPDQTDTTTSSELASPAFQVVSTSNNSAVVTSLTLRQTDSVRLVFKPTLVENPNEPQASVKGALCYQRKRRGDEWEDIQSVALSSLHAGEGVKLDLKSAEVRRLYRALTILYETVERDGIPSGTHTYFRANQSSVLAEIIEMLNGGEGAEILRSFVNWAHQSGGLLSDQLRELDGATLVSFDAAIGVTRLQRFVDEAVANLENSDESYWQDLLVREPWVISQLFACPMVIIQERAYVGGKDTRNQGGTIVDYMYANSLTQNSLLVEIKTPATPLLKASTYRNQIYGPDSELGGATQQILHARQVLQESYLGLAQNGEANFNVFGTKALLIIGTLPDERTRARSFEIYRNAQRGVEIITFDELIEKARLLVKTLSL